MTTHTTPPPHADQTDQTAEPARRAPRFDERGIALQTIIIMVVLLAIAGAIAAVIATRAGEETANLEGQTDTAIYGIENETGCKLAGHKWTPVAANAALPADPHGPALTAAGLTGGASGDIGVNLGWCGPN